MFNSTLIFGYWGPPKNKWLVGVGDPRAYCITSWQLTEIGPKTKFPTSIRPNSFNLPKVPKEYIHTYIHTYIYTYIYTRLELGPAAKKTCFARFVENKGTPKKQTNKTGS